MAKTPFSHEYTLPCHGTTEMKVLYTNTASRVEAWLTSIESTVDASERKIVGIDVEYDKLRGSSFNPKKAAVIQLCVGTEVLVYHICHADERSEKLYNFLYGYRYTFAGFCTAEDRNVLGRSKFYIHNIKDIQMIWRDPDNSKRTQGLKDVAAAIIDPVYMKMKDDFGRTEHSMWANAPPLPPDHILYAARDAYVTYEVYRRLDVFERGFFLSTNVPRRNVAWLGEDLKVV
ncbi:hypothetical protein ACQ4PT_014358 [Festuca glaucescens]